jgi:hypothetical protein
MTKDKNTGFSLEFPTFALNNSAHVFKGSIDWREADEAEHAAAAAPQPDKRLHRCLHTMSKQRLSLKCGI